MDTTVDGRAGWVTLLIAGVVNALYGLGYLVWSLIGLAWGGFYGVLAVIGTLDSGADDPAVFVMSAIAALSPLIQTVAFVIVPILALVTVFGALRMRVYRSRGVVWLGIFAAFAGPALGLLVSFFSLCSSMSTCGIGCFFGFILGNVGTLLALVLTWGLSGYSAFVLTRPDVREAFAANAA